MIFFDRNTVAPPKSLKSGKAMRGINGSIHAFMDADRERRDQTDIPAVWKTPFETDVLEALNFATNAHCAFCGLEERLDVYRFRPPAYAEPTLPEEGEASYLWLAFEWDNLFPICGACRPVNQNYFPVNGKRFWYSAFESGVGQEDAELIHPGEMSQPSRYFTILGDGSLMGKTNRARITIDHFRLNEPSKVERRESIIRLNVEDIFSGRMEWIDIDWATSDGTWYLYLQKIGKRILALRGGRMSLSPSKIISTMARLAGEDDFLERFEEAHQWFKVGEAEELRNSSDDARRLLIGTEKEGSPAESANPAPTGPVPRIARVSLTQYKSLEEISFDMASDLAPATLQRLTANAETTTSLPEAPCVLILGENATGKSSILEAIALALIPQTDRAGLGLKPSKLTLNTEYMGALEGAPVPKSEIKVGFHPDPARPDQPGREVTLQINGTPGAEAPFTEGGDRDGPLPPVFAYGAHRLYGGEDRRAPLRHVETLFHNDRQLPRPEAWLQTLSSPDLDQVARALRHIIQIDGEFHTIEANADYCRINIEKTREDGSAYIVPQRLDIVSSGYRAVFALVCDVLEGLMNHTDADVATARSTPAIVMIDEIEAHLHPRWKLHVISGLRRALPKVTFIITSHDPLCVRGMYDGEVLALNRYQNLDGAGLGVPERVEKVAGFENVETLTIEQLLTSELFQLLSTDNPEMDRSLARAADTLSQAAQDAPPDALEEIDRILTTALPYGQTEIARVVQEAVAEYLAERRQRDQGANAAARKKAKEEIKKRLRELMQ